MMNRIKPNVDRNLSLVYEPDPNPTRLFLTTSARKIATDIFTLKAMSERLVSFEYFNSKILKFNCNKKNT